MKLAPALIAPPSESGAFRSAAATRRRSFPGPPECRQGSLSSPCQRTRCQRILQRSRSLLIPSSQLPRGGPAHPRIGIVDRCVPESGIRLLGRQVQKVLRDKLLLIGNGLLQGLLLLKGLLRQKLFLNSGLQEELVRSRQRLTRGQD